MPERPDITSEFGLSQQQKSTLEECFGSPCSEDVRTSEETSCQCKVNASGLFKFFQLGFSLFHLGLGCFIQCSVGSTFSDDSGLILGFQKSEGNALPTFEKGRACLPIMGAGVNGG